MTSINTNIASMRAIAANSSIEKMMNTSMDRLSTGLRINSASDDAAGVAIVSKMTSEIRGLSQAIRNASDGQALASTAEGAMVEIESMLQRMRELAVQAANDTNSASNRSALNDEINQLRTEIDRAVNTTTFNGINLLDGSAKISLQIGASSGQTMDFAVGNLGTATLGSLTGASNTGAVTSAAMKGVEASTTKTQLSFNGNDTYKFTLNIATAAGTGTYLIEGDVTSNSAVDIVNKINDAIRANPAPTGGTYQATGASSISVSYSGNVVTIENSFGGQVDVAKTGTANYSASGSTIGFTSVNGGTSSQNLVLGSANAFAATTFANNNAYTAATAATVDITESGTLTAGDVYELVLSDGAGNDLTVTPAGVGAGPSADDGLNAIKTAFDALSDQKGYTMAVASNALTVSRADGVNFTVKLGAGAASNTGTITDSIASAVLTTTAVTTTSGVAGAGDEISNMYLEFTSADTYTLNFKDNATTPNATSAFDVTYDGTDASLAAMASVIGTKINGAFNTAHDMTVTVDQGRIKISDANGQKFSLADFASVGSGTIMASVDAGQGTTTAGDGVLLDDTTFAATGQTTAAGTPTATLANMTFSANDRFSFNIGDGSATAIVSNFAADITSVATTGDIAAEINTALSAAGLGDVITAAADGTTAGLVTLTHKNGKEITISNFKSDSTATVKVEAGTGSSGFTKFLDDGDGNSSTTVSGVSVLTETSSAEAIDILDRALQDVASERSALGAVINRLDHTVNNLTSIVINTEAAKGRVQDADFASESSNLSKAQILSQAATSMLAQANQSKQTVLALLQG